MIGAESFDCNRVVRLLNVKQDFGAGYAINIDLEIKCHAGDGPLAVRRAAVVMPELPLFVALGVWQRITVVVLP